MSPVLWSENNILVANDVYGIPTVCLNCHKNPKYGSLNSHSRAAA